MEKKLSSMFEYQRFAQNPRLSKMIEETESRYNNKREMIDDDDLWMVNAAGAPDILKAEDLKMPEDW